MRILTLLIFIFMHSLSWAQSQLRYEGFVENGGSPVNSVGESVSVAIRKPGCADSFPGLSPWVSSVSIINGEFNITPTYSPVSTFASAMDPDITWSGGAGCGPGASREMHINLLGQTFIVSLQDAPRSAFSNLAANSKALGGIPTVANMICSPSQYLTTDASGKIQCSALLPLAVGDVPTGTPINGDVTGTLASSVVSKIQNTPISVTPPAANQILKFVAGQWTPSSEGVPGDASYIQKGILKFDTDVTTSGIQISAGVASLPNVIAGSTTGSATAIPVITYDNKGRITGVGAAAPNDSTKLPLTGAVAMAGPLNMGNNNINSVNSISTLNVSLRDILVYDSGINYVTLKSPVSLPANYVLTLPNDDGSPNQTLTTDGNGVLSWSTPAGGISVTPNQAVIANGTGTGLMNFTCLPNHVFGFDGAGLPTCQSVTPAGGFLNGGNSFGADATLGTNDPQNLNIETNATTRMTIASNGNVGIATTTPSSVLDVNGALTARGIAEPPTSPVGQGRIYFDSTNNKFKVSQNGSLYIDLRPNLEDAGVFASGLTNTRLGRLSGVVLDGVNTNDNSLFGYMTGNALNTGDGNTVIGSHAGQVMTSGSSNVLIGYNAGPLLTNQNNNLFIGTNAGVNYNGTGSSNVIIGSSNGDSIENLNGTILLSNGLGAEQLVIDQDGYSKFAGALKFGNTALGCSAANMGSLRTYGTVIEFCNGANWIPLLKADSGAFINGGNAFGVSANIGTNDNNALYFRANNSTHMTLLPTGNVGIGTTSPSNLLTIFSPSASAGSPITFPLKISNGSGSGISIAATSMSQEIQTANAINSGALSINASSSPTTGSVTIGSETPNNMVKLRVSGQIASLAPSLAGSIADFTNGNTITLTSVAGSTITLQNMVSGARYSLIISDITSRVYTFTFCPTGTFYWANPNTSTTAGTRTIYNILVADSGCYIDWKSGYSP